MDDRGANIDIVFRNGLKDYEVLPPQDVWDNIQPVVRKKQRPFALLRAAAMFAVLVSLSFLAYRFSREIPAGLEGPVMVASQESFAPVNDIEFESKPVYDPSRKNDDLRSVVAGDHEVTPVATDNINSAVRFTETPAVANEIQGNNRNTDYLAVDYSGRGYLEVNSDNALDLPDNTSRKIPNRWSISALVSPTYQSRFSSGDNEAVSQVINTEQAEMSYTGGIALAYKVNRRFSIQSGIYYSTIGKELTGIVAYSGFEDHFYTKGSPNFTVLTSSGNILTSNNDIFLTDGLTADRIQTSYNNNVFDPVKSSLNYLDNSIHQNFSFLELPVVFRYKVIDRAFDFNLIGGVSSNLLVDNTVFAAGENGRTPVGNTDGVNILTFSSSLGMGMEYNLSNNLSLNLEPTFRYYLNPFNNIPGMRIHPYSFGVFSGISWKF